MANFSFLEDKTEYRSFSKECLDAEVAFENSFDSCIGLVRKAVEAAVKWVYSIDKNLTLPQKKNPADKKDDGFLFVLLSEENFKRLVGKNLLGELHHCRMEGNKAIHNEKRFTQEEAIKSLKYLFDFVQWLDRRYGKNFTPRTFDPGEIPVKDPTWKKILKGAGLVAVGVIGTLAAVLLSGDKDKS